MVTAQDISVVRLAQRDPPRYWLTDSLLVGGSIRDRADYLTLRRGYGVTQVVNCDPGEDDGKVPPACLFELPSIRHITAADPAWPHHIIVPLTALVDTVTAGGGKVYLHCQAGLGVSLTWAYALLRICYHLSRTESLARINAAVRLVVGSHPGRNGVPPFVDDAFGWVDSTLPQEV